MASQRSFALFLLCKYDKYQKDMLQVHYLKARSITKHDDSSNKLFNFNNTKKSRKPSKYEIFCQKFWTLDFIKFGQIKKILSKKLITNIFTSYFYLWPNVTLHFFVYSSNKLVNIIKPRKHKIYALAKLTSI